MKMVKLKDIFSFKPKSKIKAGDGLAEGRFPFFTSSIVLSKFINEYGFNTESLIFGTGGKASIHYCNQKFNVSTDCLVAQKSCDFEIDLKYVYHYLYTNIHILEREFKGAGLKHISKKSIDNIAIPLPSLSEQQRIAKILDTADTLRKTNEELLQNYNDLQKAIFVEMFGDPVSNEKGWEVKELIDITKKIGSGSTPTGGKKSYNLTGISLIRSLNIHDNLFKYDNLAFINDLQAKKLNNVTVLENDVLFNITGASVCRCTIVPNDVVPARVNQHVAIIRVKETKLTPHFLSYLLTNSSEKTLLLKLAKQNGATREAITKDQLEKISLIVPPISLQNQFTKIIENIEQQKDISRKSMEYSEELFAALVQELFRFEK